MNGCQKKESSKILRFMQDKFWAKTNPWKVEDNVLKTFLPSHHWKKARIVDFSILPLTFPTIERVVNSVIWSLPSSSLPYCSAILISKLHLHFTVVAATCLYWCSIGWMWHNYNQCDCFHLGSKPSEPSMSSLCTTGTSTNTSSKSGFNRIAKFISLATFHSWVFTAVHRSNWNRWVDSKHGHCSKWKQLSASFPCASARSAPNGNGKDTEGCGASYEDPWRHGLSK